METVTWERASARRMARHGLTAPVARERLAAQAGAICGVHAQVMGAAELSLALRVDGATRADVRAALWEQHALVKTYGPRGTVHLLPASELARWTGAFGAIPSAGGSAPAGVRLDDGQRAAVIAAIGDALADAELTVEELTAAVVARAGRWAGEEVMPAFQTQWPRWRQAIAAAAHAGVLCFGPPRGRAVTFTDPRRFVPGFAPAEPQAAVAWLLRRWLTAYGPATAAQFARWTAAPPQWAAELFAREAAAGGLERVAFGAAAGADTAWVVAGDAAFPEDPLPAVRLLPHYDAYAIGCFPRERLFPGAAAERALARGQAGPYPLLLLDGVVGGVWHQRRAGRRLAVTVEPLRPLSAAQRRGLDAEVARVGAIAEATPSLAVGPVRVGAHA